MGFSVPFMWTDKEEESRVPEVVLELEVATCLNSVDFSE